MYLLLPFNDERVLKALFSKIISSSAARTAFTNLAALRATPLEFFNDMGDAGHLDDELKEIVARGFKTKDELKDAILPYLTDYKLRMDAQRERVMAPRTSSRGIWRRRARSRTWPRWNPRSSRPCPG